MKWIDSEEQMPPPYEEVLMWQPGTFRIICFKPDVDSIWFNYESSWPTPNVGRFYWMPLPQPPESR